MPSPPPAGTRELMSGNAAVARGVWDAGCKVAAAYPGTPSTEILEYLSFYPNDQIYAEWSVNEKVSLEVAIGAAISGSRSFCAMKHVGMNVASDALMTQTLCGVDGGLVIAIADDVGLSSSQNEQDSRYWGRFAHLPILEPCDSQEAYEMTIKAFEVSEQFNVPVILRLTTRICHVKSMVTMGERTTYKAAGFKKDPSRWVMSPNNAKLRIPEMYEREQTMAAYSETSPLNVVEDGSDKTYGFVTSGPAYTHVRETYPDAPVLKLGFSYPLPIEMIRSFAEGVETLVVVEETEDLIEQALKAAGIPCRGKDVLSRFGELAPNELRKGITRIEGGKVAELPANLQSGVFPRPPTMCVACPHLAVYYSLSRIRNLHISGDIGCYTLGAGHPWEALDTTISMGASMGIALGMDKGRGDDDENKKIVAVIGDSTFMHMGMQGLLDIVYAQGNVTVLLLDNRAVGMTGGQENPGTGHDLYGRPAPRVDFAQMCEAMGVRKERIHVLDPYELPTLYNTIRAETKAEEPSVIITNQPCVLTDYYDKRTAFEVIDEKCTGCANCLDVGCPAIKVTRRENVVKPNGKEVELAFVNIESAACTGSDLSTKTCKPHAIVPVGQTATGETS